MLLMSPVCCYGWLEIFEMSIEFSFESNCTDILLRRIFQEVCIYESVVSDFFDTNGGFNSFIATYLHGSIDKAWLIRHS